MKVLLSSKSFTLDYGGPAYSVSRLGLALAEKGASVAIWAPDGSATGAKTLWSSMVDHTELQFLTGPLAKVLDAFGPLDLIHDSGLWLPHNHALAREANRRRISRVVSTRGMLDPWAVAHKRFKKRIAWHLYQKRDLEAADALHVTSEAEAIGVAREIGSAEIWQMPNGVDLPPLSELVFQSERVHRKAVFIGRLHPVKGLPVLLDAWARSRPENWELVIAGPDEGGHRSVLEDKIRRLGLTDRVFLVGEVAGAQKTELLRSSDLFVLPSQSESFGIVVAEALAHGLPVLTTENVPWPQLEEHKCGWRVKLDSVELGDALSRTCALPRGAMKEAGLRGRELVESKFSWSAIAEGFLSHYAALLSRRLKANRRLIERASKAVR